MQLILVCPPPEALNAIHWMALLGSPTAPALLLFVVVTIIFAVLAAYLFRDGAKSKESNRLPPPTHRPAHGKPHDPEDDIPTQEIRPISRPVRIPSSDNASAREADTSPKFDLEDPVTAPITDPHIYEAPSPAEVREYEKSNPHIAAKMWEQLANWPAAAVCYEKAEEYYKAAQIWIALERYERALPLLRRALKDEPKNDFLRLRLVETLTDLGRRDEAQELIEAVLPGDAPLQATPRFLEAVGRIHEALGERSLAANFYRQSLAMDEKLPEVPQRLAFLRQLERLAAAPADADEQKNTARRIMEKYIEESNNFGQNGSQDEVPKPRAADEQEIIVGHLALGFQHPEPKCSVRSVFSLSRRFALQRLLSESPKSAVFEAYDRLLDFPVALRLHRLRDEEMRGLDILRLRLQSIAQLNHPNLAKVMFVQRDGAILILATEYLPGGNLREFLNKLGGVGLPLLIRMAMHLTSGIHSAHSKGIPHGDIRPENIIIGTDQRIKLVDFRLSPIPTISAGDLPDPLSSREETPAHLTTDNMGVHSDILQFADVLKFMLDHVRYVPPQAQSADLKFNPMEEMQELAKRVRAGEFSSMLRLWQILEQIFERTIPASTETPRVTK